MTFIRHAAWQFATHTLTGMAIAFALLALCGGCASQEELDEWTGEYVVVQCAGAKPPAGSRDVATCWQRFGTDRKSGPFEQHWCVAVCP